MTDQTVVRQFAPKAMKQGALVIDNSGLYDDDNDYPLVVPEINGSELDLEADLMVDDLNDVSTKENDFSKKDLRVLHSLMDAFDVDFKTAVSEFWWNLNGERKEDNSGFWF